jgi:hypothetical protein
MDSNKCKSCGSELEPHFIEIPVYNGGFVPESIKFEFAGYFPCECQCFDFGKETVKVTVIDDLPF